MIELANIFKYGYNAIMLYETAPILVIVFPSTEYVQRYVQWSF